jgi:hypothetical protein
MNGFKTVSEVARRYGVPPRVISDAFYGRLLDDRLCPVLGGRRFIPESYLPMVEAYLRASGRIPQEAISA